MYHFNSNIPLWLPPLVSISSFTWWFTFLRKVNYKYSIYQLFKGYSNPNSWATFSSIIITTFESASSAALPRLIPQTLAQILLPQSWVHSHGHLTPTWVQEVYHWNEGFEDTNSNEASSWEEYHLVETLKQERFLPHARCQTDFFCSISFLAWARDSRFYTFEGLVGLLQNRVDSPKLNPSYCYLHHTHLCEVFLGILLFSLNFLPFLSLPLP